MSRCCWSSPDEEQKYPYLHCKRQLDFQPSKPAQQQRFFVTVPPVLLCLYHTQANRSWASIKHQFSSPAVHCCGRETESVLPVQSLALSQSQVKQAVLLHNVSLHKLHLLSSPSLHCSLPPIKCFVYNSWQITTASVYMYDYFFYKRCFWYTTFISIV